VLPATAVVLAAQIALFPDRRFEWPAAALGAAAFFVVARLLSGCGIGMGDVKLALLLGAGLGTDVVPAIALGAFAAGVFGVLLLARRGASARRATIPYGPFLAAGAIVVVLLG
jgi:leader peptidase (prepilin peptidase) / N-methyltransferase